MGPYPIGTTVDLEGFDRYNQLVSASTCYLCLSVSLDYPWRWNTPVMINSALIKWIYLPDFYTIPNSKNLIGESTPPSEA